MKPSNLLHTLSTLVLALAAAAVIVTVASDPAVAQHLYSAQS